MEDDNSKRDYLKCLALKDLPALLPVWNGNAIAHILVARIEQMLERLHRQDVFKMPRLMQGRDGIPTGGTGNARAVREVDPLVSSFVPFSKMARFFFATLRAAYYHQADMSVGIQASSFACLNNGSSSATHRWSPELLVKIPGPQDSWNRAMPPSG